MRLFYPKIFKIVSLNLKIFELSNEKLYFSLFPTQNVLNLIKVEASPLRTGRNTVNIVHSEGHKHFEKLVT